MCLQFLQQGYSDIVIFSIGLNIDRLRLMLNSCTSHPFATDWPHGIHLLICGYCVAYPRGMS